MTDFSSRVKEIRMRLNITQAEMADATGVDSRSWQRYENGETKSVPSDVVKRAAIFLNVNVGYLMGIYDDPLTPEQRRKKEEEERTSKYQEILERYPKLRLFPDRLHCLIEESGNKDNIRNAIRNQLATQLNLSYQDIVRMEEGDFVPDITQIVIISRFLDIDVNYILGVSEDPIPFKEIERRANEEAAGQG